MAYIAPFTPPGMDTESLGNVVYIGLDIEGSGSLQLKLNDDGSIEYNNNPLAIGYAAVDIDGNLVEKGRIAWPVDRGMVEPRCWNEFWSKHQDVFAVLESESADEFGGMSRADALKKAINATAAWWIDMCLKYPDFVLVSDNPEYDVCALNVALSLAGIRDSQYRVTERPTPENGCDYQYDYKGCVAAVDWHYRGDLGWAPSQWSSDAMVMKKYGIPALGVEHDHFPENDSHTHALRYVRVLKAQAQAQTQSQE